MQNCGLEHPKQLLNTKRLCIPFYMWKGPFKQLNKRIPQFLSFNVFLLYTMISKRFFELWIACFLHCCSALL